METVKVLARIRPEPKGSPPSVLMQQDEHTVVLLPKPYDGSDAMQAKRAKATAAKAFTLDVVHGAEATQLDVYRTAKPLALSVIQGYNATIFAYGHTGSGKTHTMMGLPGDPGIIPRTVADVFESMKATAAAQPETMFMVRMSYVELYNNNFRNLLDWRLVEGGSGDGGVAHGAAAPHDNTMSSDPGSAFRAARADGRIEVRESKVAGVHLSGPGLRAPVTSAQHVMKLLEAGNAMRAVGNTHCNEHSSRSHAILTLYVESRAGLHSAAEVRMGKLHLVDLAGSERVSLSGAEGGTLLEAQQINLSLTVLGDVLSALSKNATISTINNNNSNSNNHASISASIDTSANGVAGGSNENVPPLPGGSGASMSGNDEGYKAPQLQQLAPVPYRNSKLTHLLKDSLGGNSKTLMIATLRGSSEFHPQSMMSLMYASRAKRIRNVSVVNCDAWRAGEQPQSGLGQVSADLLGLEQRLAARTQEFDRLKDLRSNDQAENRRLRERLEALSLESEAERAEMEAKVAQVIHNSAGQVSMQRAAVADLSAQLTAELTGWQAKCKEQKEEIEGLKQLVGALEEVRSTKGATVDEVRDMQAVLDAWQTQAGAAQKELLLVSAKLKEAAESRAMDRARAAELERELEHTRAAATAETQARLSRNADSEAERHRLAELVETLQEAAKAHAQERAAALEAVQQARAEKEEGQKEQEGLRNELESRLAAVVGELANEKEARSREAERAKAETERLAANAKEGTNLATAEMAAADALRLERQVLVGEKAKLQASLEALQQEHANLQSDLRRFQASVVAVQRDTQSLVEEKTAALSAATKQAGELTGKVTLLEAELSHEREAGEEACRQQEEAEARAAQLEVQLRALESERAHFAARQPELEQQLRVALESSDRATREVQEMMEHLAASESNCRDAESAKMSLLGELEAAAAGLASSEEQLRVANGTLLAEQERLAELEAQSKATQEKDRAASAQALHELEQKMAQEVEAMARQHACALEAMASEAKVELERCTQQAAHEASQRTFAEAQVERQQLLLGFEAASKEDDAARFALEQKLRRSEEAADQARQAAEVANVKASEAFTVREEAEQRCQEAEAAAAESAAGASRTKEVEEALQECARELEAVRAQMSDQGEERMSLEEELRSMQEAYKEQSDVAGQLRGEVGQLTHALTVAQADLTLRTRSQVEAEEAVAQLDALCSKAHADLAEQKRKLIDMVQESERARGVTRSLERERDDLLQQVQLRDEGAVEAARQHAATNSELEKQRARAENAMKEAAEARAHASSSAAELAQTLEKHALQQQQLEQELAVARDEVDDSARGRRDAEQRAIHADARAEHAEGQLADAEARALDAEAARKALEDHTAAGLKERNELVKLLEASGHDLTSRVSELKGLLALAEDEHATNRAELERRIEAMAEEQSLREKQHTEALAQAQADATQRSETQKAKMALMEQQISDTKLQLEEALSTIETQKQEVDDANHAVIEAKNTAAEAHARAEASAAAAAQTVKEATENARSSFDDAAARATAKAAEAFARMEHEAQRRSEAEASCQAANERAQMAEDAASAAEQRAQEASARAEEVATEAETLKCQVQELEQSRANAVSALREAQTQAKLQEEQSIAAADADARAAAAETALGALKKEWADESAQLRSEIEESKADMAKVKEEAAASVAEMSSEVQRAESARLAAVALATDAQTRVLELTTTLNESKEDCQKVQARYDQLQEQAQASDDALRAQQIEAKQEQERLEEALSERTKSAEEAMANAAKSAKEAQESVAAATSATVAEAVAEAEVKARAASEETWAAKLQEVEALAEAAKQRALEAESRVAEAAAQHEEEERRLQEKFEAAVAETAVHQKAEQSLQDKLEETVAEIRQQCDEMVERANSDATSAETAAKEARSALDTLEQERVELLKEKELNQKALEKQREEASKATAEATASAQSAVEAAESAAQERMSAMKAQAAAVEESLRADVARLEAGLADANVRAEVAAAEVAAAATQQAQDKEEEEAAAAEAEIALAENNARDAASIDSSALSEPSRSDVATLKGHLERETRQRKELLSRAAQRWVPDSSSGRRHPSSSSSSSGLRPFHSFMIGGFGSHSSDVATAASAKAQLAASDPEAAVLAACLEGDADAITAALAPLGSQSAAQSPMRPSRPNPLANAPPASRSPSHVGAPMASASTPPFAPSSFSTAAEDAAAPSQLFLPEALQTTGERAWLPLHRAVSGFHFHGNQRFLLRTLAVLLDLGASVHAPDPNGGATCLHKAIQVCSSAAVLPVARLLLSRGADPNARTSSSTSLDGDTCIATELRRLRSKSPEVVDLLVVHGADVNALLGPCGDTALSLVLSCAQRRALQLAPAHSDAPSFGRDLHSNNSGSSSSVRTSLNDSRDSVLSSYSTASSVTSASHSGRCFWVPVAHVLVERGAAWGPPSRRDPLGRTTLHLLFTGPAPPPKDAPLFNRLVASALQSSLRPCVDQPDAQGDTPLSLAMRQARGQAERSALRETFEKYGVKLPPTSGNSLAR